MIDIKTVTLEDVMPENLLQDAGVINAVKALDKTLHGVALEMQKCLLLARIDELDEAVVDLLAWQFHVDFYDSELPIEKKRALVKQSIAWHRRKGTPAAVEEVCTAVFKSARVFENWEYGGEPYHFQVRLIEEGIPDKSMIDNLYRTIKATKNTRSWLDGLSFFRQLLAKVNYGILVGEHKVVRIYSSKFVQPDIYGKQHIALAQRCQRKVEITCQIGTV
ncbi:MAG: phage tail protein I [Acidaminococcaceae bacterium]